MICHDLKTVIIEYVHDDGQIKLILEWEKACQWNRLNLVKQIKYKNWMEDDLGYQADKFDDVQHMHHQYINQIKLSLLHQLVQRYKYDFYELKDVYDFINYVLHKIYELNERRIIGKPKCVYIDPIYDHLFPGGMYIHEDVKKAYIQLETMILNQVLLSDMTVMWESNVQTKFKAYNVNDYCEEIAIYKLHNECYVCRIDINHIKQEDYNILVKNLEKMIETQFN